MALVPVRGADGGTYQLEYVTGPGGGLVPATPVDGNQLSQGGGTSSSTTQQLVAANSSRRRIDISNAGDSDVWLHFGASSAVAGQGTLLPGRAQGSYYTTARVAMINEASGTNVAIGYTEW
jgi:hypothetical protein